MSEHSGIDRLAKDVDASPDEMADFAALEQTQITWLIDGFAQAQKRQREQLETCIDEAISYVPAPMRRPVLRVLRGKKGLGRS